MSKEVPAIKKLLEELIFRARDMASKIPFLQDIRISTLKHRRIDGTAMRKEDIEDEILSQAVYSPEDSASDDGRRPGAKHKRNSQGLRPSATPSKSLNRERHSSSSRDKERTQIPVAKNKSRNKRSLNHSIAANSDTEDKEIIRIEENNVPKLLAESDEEGEVEYLDGNNEENEIGYSGSESVSDDSDHIPVSERPHQKIKISDRNLAGTSIQRKSSKTSKRGKRNYCPFFVKNILLKSVY